MIQVTQVEIRYFRSIHRLKLSDINHMNVIAGRNDIGKSNVLRALNLFFNGETDWATPLDFDRDFSRRRLDQVRRETVKGKQFIQVAVWFERGDRYPTLPTRFSVRRTWSRDGSMREQTSITDDFKNGRTSAASEDRAQAALQRYLQTIRFEYVPAVKDMRFFDYLLTRLQDVILVGGLLGRGADNDLIEMVAGLNETVRGKVDELATEFERVSGVATSIRLPAKPAELFRAFTVSTPAVDGELPLSSRGDGLRLRYIPSLLHYIAAHSRNKFYIWGFEEPENSLEHRLATELAQTMARDYAREGQLLLTSHSPAFISLRDENVTVIHAGCDDLGTCAAPIRTSDIKPDPATASLDADLGLLQLQEQYQEQVLKLVDTERQKNEDLTSLVEALTDSQVPVVFTEGKWDRVILGEAWAKLYPNDDAPFQVKECTAAADGITGGTGGLVNYMKGAQADLRPFICVFDRDDAGLTAYGKLPHPQLRTFPNLADVAFQPHGRAAAILLPGVPGREQYAENRNLPLEFYFPDEALNTRVEGRGLVLRNRRVQRRVVGLRLDFEPDETTEPYLREIDDDSKAAFAEDVVPTLPLECFDSFSTLFKLIMRGFTKLEDIRQQGG